MSHILLTHLDKLFGVLQVIIPVGQAKAAYRKCQLVTIGIRSVGTYIETKWAGGVVDLGAAKTGNEVFPCLNFIECGQSGQQRADAQLVERFHVHVAQVVVADLLLDGTSGGFHGCQIINNGADTLVRAVAQYGERPIIAATGRQLESFQPAAIGVAKKVVTRLYICILMAEVDTETAELGCGGFCCGIGGNGFSCSGFRRWRRS